MSKIQSTLKARQPKLRASCNGCFLAKVKCNKERPVCSRCLTTGAECGYSPSCRTGKSKTVSSPVDQVSINSPLESVYEESAITYSALNNDMTFTGDSMPYGDNPSWVSIQGHPDHGFQRRSISTSTAPSLIHDTSTTPESINGGPSTDAFDNQYSFNPSMRPPNGSHLARSKSFADLSVFAPLDLRTEGQRNDMFMSEQTLAMGPFEKELYSPIGNAEFISSPNNGNPSCNCFNASLQALQALHNHTASTIPAPSFDIVLTINRRAIDACNNMLNCPKCIWGINSNTSTMHLATIIGKVMSFYRAASQNYFGLTTQNANRPQPLPLTIGSYKISEEDGRWLEMEILLRELRKLEEVLGIFQDVCQDAEAEMEGGMQSAVITYLKQSLGVTFEVLNMRRQSARV